MNNLTPEEAAKKIRELLGKGKSLSEIISENPELIRGLDEIYNDLIKESLQASMDNLVQREIYHGLLKMDY